jgi:tRNA nucleotidyltransferase (CCA-adding enzyme)
MGPAGRASVPCARPTAPGLGVARSRQNGPVRQEIEDYVRSLGLDAYLVGGAVRDELLGLDSKDADFVVPGLDTEALRAALQPYGRVEDLIVAGRLVGVRLHPADRAIRKLAPAGIELAPTRKEVSTGPGRHDFEIVADPSLTVEDDMGRRDFTVNAMARRLADGQLVDPFGGRTDLERRVLRTVSQQSFREDPLRLVRALRFVSQLGFEPDAELLAQMRQEAPAVKLVSGERIGGGLAADGMGELSKLLLGAEPARALRLARDTGVLVELLPEFEAAIGFDQESRYHDLTVDEHTFAVVQAAAGLGFALSVRLAGLFHDLGKPHTAWRGKDGRLHYYAKPGVSERGHDQVGAELAAGALSRLRYPNALRQRAVRIVRRHMFQVGAGVERGARRFLHRNGVDLAFELLDHKRADLLGKRDSDGGPPPEEELDRLAAFRQVVERERKSPHRLADLAVDGSDLLELGFTPGPALGRVLGELLDSVVDEPSLNTRDELLARASERL